ncbi:hypothetical protein L207DRAFT_582480 [Hyaloscypha variabilis F]|uniref:Heterokaryon incompatibility domain-containing protein n=1 Tax=Hyaloscypha variabilis (strain UAMH 11265 / GT02V1 / F) TaxID=1149755 RepID=A0A2J6RP38_HYAVF|nr:hypothetical protein L207DRAFT_582480 [Hyaloscypha variabilis F]
MPLLRRGWTFQDRLLPTRTIHFTTTQIFWECYETFACECLSEIIPDDIIEFVESFHKEPIDISMWGWIVQIYSTRDLTKSSDKLVAISGLARKIQEQTHVEYLAGLWRNGLELQLCWSRWDPLDNPLDEDFPYRAPTWSWASQRGGVALPWRSKYSESCHLYVNVLEVKTTPLGQDPLGGIADGYLNINCTLFSLGLPENCLNVPPRGILTLSQLGYDDKRRTYSKTSYFLPVQLYGKDHDKIIGLILEPTKMARGQYKRVGMFDFEGPNIGGSIEEISKNRDFAAQESDYISFQQDTKGEKRCIQII